MLLEGLCLEPSETLQRAEGRDGGTEGRRELSLSVPSLGYVKYKAKLGDNLPIDFSGIS